jgi:hypothetical protein
VGLAAQEEDRYQRGRSCRVQSHERVAPANVYLAGQ